MLSFHGVGICCVNGKIWQDGTTVPTTQEMLSRYSLLLRLSEQLMQMGVTG